MFTFLELRHFMNTKEEKIVHIALENLEKNTKIKGDWENNVIGKDNGIDGVITLNVDNKEYKIFIEVKTGLRNHQLYQIEEIANTHKPFLLIAEHLFPKIKEELRQKGIAYLETNGNIYFKNLGMYLWIDNQKPLQTGKEKTNRAFTKTGLRLVFHFLLNNEFVNYPYRDIAQKAGVGLGNINYVMNGLKETGFLLKLNKNEYKLVNKKELLEKWLVAYQERLKPVLNIGTFRFLKNEDFLHWKNLPIKTGITFWGGEAGGDLLTHYLKPEILTIYTDESRNDLIKNYRLIPDNKGNVQVYKKFWNYNEVNWNIAPPELVYADLINTGDRRCMETAKKILDEYLQNKL